MPAAGADPIGPIESENAAIVTEACRAMDAAGRAPALKALALAAGLSPSHFHRVFKAATGLTPRQYAAGRRAERARAVLTTAASVTASVYDAGFGSSGRFYAAARGMLGMRPTDYRAGGARLDIIYGTGRCSLGQVLVGRTDRGLCAVMLGDDASRLIDDLRSRFPRARLLSGDQNFRDTIAAVIRLVDRPAEATDLPLDLHGTLFQQRVWQALRAIPAGATVTYGELARRLGAPAAVRAVAQACGANPVAVAVPCHRVVARDGALTGYRWGIERKRALLEREQAPPVTPGKPV